MSYRLAIPLVWIGVLLAQKPPQSPAQVSISKAEAQIATHPDHYPNYNALAMAYARLARETSDVKYYAKAEEVLAKSFALSPGNFEGQKVKAWLLLGRHEFSQAAELASRLNKQNADDVTVYGYLADANAELGNYKEAVSATQWMLNIKPGNIAGLARAGYLRELHGDISGALEVMQMAYDATPYQEFEDRAWLCTQMSHLYLLDGDIPKAERAAESALGLFPGYHYALGALAQVRIAQKRPSDAVPLLQKRYDAARHAENLFALGEALHMADRKDEAARAFAEFERLALKESGLADNANHELIAYYADFAEKPAAALEIASREIARRHDVYTRDSYAWALARNGDLARADVEIRKALAIGVKDPRILHHARVIALRLEEASRRAEAVSMPVREPAPE